MGSIILLHLHSTPSYLSLFLKIIYREVFGANLQPSASFFVVALAVGSKETTQKNITPRNCSWAVLVLFLWRVSMTLTSSSRDDLLSWVKKNPTKLDALQVKGCLWEKPTWSRVSTPSQSSNKTHLSLWYFSSLACQGSIPWKMPSSSYMPRRAEVSHLKCQPLGEKIATAKINDIFKETCWSTQLSCIGSWSLVTTRAR